MHNVVHTVHLAPHLLYVVNNLIVCNIQLFAVVLAVNDGQSNDSKFMNIKTEIKYE